MSNFTLSRSVPMGDGRSSMLVWKPDAKFTGPFNAVLNTKAWSNFGFWDRIRIVFTGRCECEINVLCEHETGSTQTEIQWRVL